MKHLDVCATCSEPSAAHHAFTPVEISDACLCDPKTWEMKPPDICAAFVPWGNATTFCRTCRHDPACHASAVPEAKP